MSSLFISDLHLRPDQPELIEKTVQFLKQNSEGTEKLYILGDLFNTWLGDDIVPEEYQRLINALQQLSTSGIETYLMVGNRDFMMGQDFAQRCGCKLLNDPTVIDFDGKKVLLVHGDSLCTDDISYQRYRRWTRNKFLQWCFLALPARRRQAISDKIKQKSKQQKQSKSATIMDVNQQAVRDIMDQFNVNYLLHGHTHRPAIHQLDNSANYRIVLGDWDGQSSFIKYDNKQLTLFDHRLKTGQQSLVLA